MLPMPYDQGGNNTSRRHPKPNLGSLEE